ncbi:hypothetical protein EPN96_07215 [bacterium]|nr:MAG: hypothetical protein EPN96_07215 [bacterium]
MHVRRAIIMMTVLSLGLFLCGCGMFEGYEAGAVLQVVSNPGTTVTVTVDSVSGNELNLTLRNYPRKGVGEQSLDVIVTSVKVQLVDLEGTAYPVVTYPGNMRISPNGEADITLFGVVPFAIIEAIQADPGTLDVFGNFRADMVITAKEVDINGNFGDSLSVSDSAAVVVLFE